DQGEFGRAQSIKPATCCSDPASIGTRRSGRQVAARSDHQTCPNRLRADVRELVTQAPSGIAHNNEPSQGSDSLTDSATHGNKLSTAIPLSERNLPVGLKRSPVIRVRTANKNAQGASRAFDALSYAEDGEGAGLRFFMAVLKCWRNSDGRPVWLDYLVSSALQIRHGDGRRRQ